MYPFTEEDAKIHLSEILKVNAFPIPLLKRMYGSISIEDNKIRRASRTLLFGLSLFLKIATRLK